MRLGSLHTRELEARELMDDPDCDVQALRRTYEQFRIVNRLVSGWRQVYTGRLRPLLSPRRTTTLLDIGFGGGDVPRALAGWARHDRLPVQITAIDPDERAHQFASALPLLPAVTFRQATSAQLVAEGASFDLVISNHLLHHLDGAGLTALLSDSERLARRLVIHNDIARGRLAYAAYAVASRLLGRRSFIRYDGLLSIRRSYRPRELASVVGADWRVVEQFPSRILLVHEADSGPGMVATDKD